MLGEIETRLQAAGHAIATTGSKNGLIATSGSNGAQDGGLVDLAWKECQHAQDRGDEHLAKFLVMQQLFTEER